MTQQLDAGATSGAGVGVERPARGPRSRARPADPPQPATGVDLIGEYEASGYKEAPCLVRRGDGQTIQLTPLLYSTLELVDGRRTNAEVAAELSERIGRQVSADNVRYLVTEKLWPPGLVKDGDGSDPPVQKSNPLLALRLRLQVTNEQWTNRLAAPFSFLFRPWVALPVVAAFLAVAAWVVAVRGMGGGTRALLYSPTLMLATFGMLALSASFHELGHAAGCRCSGGRPGVMGCGLYLVWPAFYTDVTDAYRLDRAGRLRTDLGGIYFNAIFALGTFAVWAVTGSEAVLVLIPLQILQMLMQLLPFVRLDGYHILSDLVGVPDLFARIKPTLLSLVPGRRSEAADALKPWVRVVIALWVLTVVPLLVFSLLLVVITAPRAVATAWDSVGLQWRDVNAALSDRAWAAMAVGALGVIATVLPILGSGYILSRFGRRAGTWAWSSAGNVPFGRPGLAAAGVAAAAALAFMWWPNGEYRPLQPGEKGTITEAFEAVSSIGGGRPGLTPEREAELGGAPARAWTLGEAKTGAPAPAATDGNSPAPGPTTRPASPAEDSDDEPVPTSAPVRQSTTTTTVRSTTTTAAPTTTTTTTRATTAAP